MHDLARDIGAAPSLFCWLWKSPRVAMAYALGQAYITFFRLEGPFATASAKSISERELFRPVADRKIAANALFVAIILLFGYINLLCWCLEKCLAIPLAAAGMLSRSA